MEYENDLLVSYYEYMTREMGLWNSEKYVFEQFVDKSSKILDLGCGNGRTTFGLYNIGYKNIIGLDISKKMIEKCKETAKKTKKNDLQFLCSNAENMRFDDKSFDCVFFSYGGLMTINKEAKRLNVVKEVSRVLKDHGIFIFTTYDREKNTEFQKYWQKEKEKWNNNKQNKKYEKFGDRICPNSPNGKFTHVPIYKEIKELCDKCDLKIIWSNIRSQICQEKNNVMELSDDCIFYITQKK